MKDWLAMVRVTNQTILNKQTPRPRYNFLLLFMFGGIKPSITFLLPGMTRVLLELPI